MLVSELRKGDILCFQTKFDVPEHVGIYTGDIDGLAYVTHSANNYPNSGVQTTVLRDVGVIHVFRPQNAELGILAADLMLDWARYRVPYDHRRMNWMLDVSKIVKSAGRKADQQEPVDHLLDYLLDEAKLKFYERIKFAARRETCPVKMLEGIEPRGFTCVQAVILAYQIAELIPYVKTLSEVQLDIAKIAETVESIKETWISDKHAPLENIARYADIESYMYYYNHLMDQEEYTDFCFFDKRATSIQDHYRPCLDAWRFDKEPDIDSFIADFKSCLNLPAKICYTDALYAYISKDQKNWQTLGRLDRSTLPKVFSTSQKETHRQRKSDLEIAIDQNRQTIVRERSLSSPRLSLGSLSPTTALFLSANGEQSPRGFFRRISSAASLDVALPAIEEEKKVVLGPSLRKI